MTFEEFMYYLDAYGASFERWPRELRPTAEAFLAASPAAAAARAETARLDALLDRFDIQPERGRKARVMARVRAFALRPVPETPRRLSMSARVGTLWPRAAALAAVAVLGIIAGSFQLEGSESDQPTVDVAQLHSDDSPYEVAGL